MCYSTAGVPLSSQGSDSLGRRRSLFGKERAPEPLVIRLIPRLRMMLIPICAKAFIRRLQILATMLSVRIDTAESIFLLGWERNVWIMSRHFSPGSRNASPLFTGVTRP